ncbi:MAG: phage portal protein [Rubrivivax sp.]|nr:MAG: phage portal protein [Rubrivivax sp.]
MNDSPTSNPLHIVLGPEDIAPAISLSPSDLQLLEANRFQVAEICRAFSVPPHLLEEPALLNAAEEAA